MASYGQMFNALGEVAARMNYIALQNVSNAVKTEDSKTLAGAAKKMLESAESKTIEGVKREEEIKAKEKADKAAIQKRNRYFLYAGGAFVLYLLTRNEAKNVRS